MEDAASLRHGRLNLLGFLEQDGRESLCTVAHTVSGSAAFVSLSSANDLDCAHARSHLWLLRSARAPDDWRGLGLYGCARAGLRFRARSSVG